MEEPKQLDFTSLPNIGQVLSQRLQEAEIKSISQMQEMGAEKVFIRLKTIDTTACIHELYAIAGAIEGIRWHQMSKERKAELKEFFSNTFSPKK